MDLNHITTFVRVVETQSFTLAARALGVPKSSVSRSLAKLEDELGARLLQRTTRKLSLTEAGQAYYARVQKLMSGIDEANAEAQEVGQTARGIVRVTAPLDIGVTILGDIVAEFCLAHPQVHVEVNLTSRVVSLVEEGFDMALRAGKLTDSSLVARKLGTTELGLYASKTYLKKHAAPTHPKDLAAHECVLFRGTRGRATWSLNGPDGDLEIEVKGAISGDDMSFVQRVTRAGAGIGMMPIFLCVELQGQWGLVRVLPEYARRGGMLHLVMPSAQYLPARVTLLRDFIIEKTKRVNWTGE